MLKRLIDTTARELTSYNKAELLTAISDSEGRTLAAETIGTVTPMLVNITNAEFVASLGADLIMLNIFDVNNPIIQGLPQTSPEDTIREVKRLIRENARLAWMFENCFPNTLDTTVHYDAGEGDGKEDTFVYTGDIHAMWLRDSAAQVWPYVQFAKADPKVKKMIRGVIRRQLKCINIDPYANAFNKEPQPEGGWMNDITDMKPELHERKYEIDSLCYPIRLAYHYWQTTGDASVFDAEWQKAVKNVLRVFHEQQRKTGLGTYHFQRETEDQLDTVCNHGWGNPVKPVGLIASVFRPSDDAATFLFLVPSNFMAVSSLRKAAEILDKVNGEAPEKSKQIGRAHV